MSSPQNVPGLGEWALVFFYSTRSSNSKKPQTHRGGTRFKKTTFLRAFIKKFHRNSSYGSVFFNCVWKKNRIFSNFGNLFRKSFWAIIHLKKIFWAHEGQVWRLSKFSVLCFWRKLRFFNWDFLWKENFFLCIETHLNFVKFFVDYEKNTFKAIRGIPHLDL